jgi:hypothetical protein
LTYANDANDRHWSGQVIIVDFGQGDHKLSSMV